MTDTITTGPFGGTYDVTSDVWFDIDGMPSATTAWRCRNPFEPLRPAPHRGTSPDVVPNADGVVPNPQWLDGADRDLLFTVWGTVDAHGDPITDGPAGVILNARDLGQVGDIPDNPATTRTITYHLGVDEWTGTIQVLEPVWNTITMPGFMAVTIPIFIPAGALELTP